jgi:hypothetical protein
MEQKNLKLLFECIDPKTGTMKIEPVCIEYGLNIHDQYAMLRKDQLLHRVFENKSRWGCYHEDTNEVRLSREAFLRWCMHIDISMTAESLRGELIHLIMIDVSEFNELYYGDCRLTAMENELLKENPKFIQYLEQKAASEEAQERIDKALDKLRREIEAEVLTEMRK